MHICQGLLIPRSYYPIVVGLHPIIVYLIPLLLSLEKRQNSSDDSCIDSVAIG